MLYFCSLQTWIRKMIGCYKGVKYAIYCLEDGTGCSNDHCYWSVTLLEQKYGHNFGGSVGNHDYQFDQSQWPLNISSFSNYFD